MSKGTDYAKQYAATQKNVRNVLNPVMSNGLRMSEYNAIENYTGNAFVTINQFLRGERDFSSKESEDIRKRVLANIRNIDRALARLTSHQGVSYRVVKHLSPDQSKTFFERHGVGKIVKYKEYLSTSTVKGSPGSSFDWRSSNNSARLVIIGKTGKHTNHIEKEVTFPRGSKFKVTTIEGNTIYMKQIKRG